MAYIDRHHAEHRTVALVAVTVIEAAVIFGVVQGLAYTFKAPPRIPNPEVTGIPLDPEPVPTPEPLHPKPNHRDPLPTPQTPEGPDTSLGSGEGIHVFPTGTATDFGKIPDDVVKPPVFLPRAAKPINDRASWVREIDYPRGDLHAGHQGAARFSLAIDTEGRVTDCTIVTSTGFPGLDAATCAKVTERARFEPATDSSGAKVGGSYSGTIRWVIPD